MSPTGMRVFFLPPTRSPVACTLHGSWPALPPLHVSFLGVRSLPPTQKLSQKEGRNEQTNHLTKKEQMDWTCRAESCSASWSICVSHLVTPHSSCSFRSLGQEAGARLCCLGVFAFRITEFTRLGNREQRRLYLADKTKQGVGNLFPLLVLKKLPASLQQVSPFRLVLLHTHDSLTLGSELPARSLFLQGWPTWVCVHMSVVHLVEC